MDVDGFERLLPDRPLFHKMKSLLHFYLDQPLDWDVEAHLIPGEIETACLAGTRWSRLGWNTWLFSDGCMPKNAAVKFRDQDLQ